jgi:hypothetical protein
LSKRLIELDGVVTLPVIPTVSMLIVHPVPDPPVVVFAVPAVYVQRIRKNKTMSIHHPKSP